MIVRAEEDARLKPGDTVVEYTGGSTGASNLRNPRCCWAGRQGPHRIEGVGIGYTPPLWAPSLVDEILSVRTDEAKDMARRIAREEALFAGTSAGANVVAAIQVAQRLGPSAKVVTLMADSGLKYLSTDVYRAGRSGPAPAGAIR